MGNTLLIQCRCGQVKGLLRNVSAKTSNRGRCYCDDCQSFAHFLGAAGVVLDEQGGTTVLQISPRSFGIRHGAEHIACMQLRPDGLLRWYTNCCGTPLGNTLRQAWIPFVGVIETCLHAPEEGQSLQEIAGPVRAAVYTQYARGDAASLPPVRGGTAVMTARVARLILRGLVRRDSRRSPFFDRKTRLPSVRPYVLSPAELAAVEAKRDAWR